MTQNRFMSPFNKLDHEGRGVYLHQYFTAHPSDRKNIIDFQSIESVTRMLESISNRINQQSAPTYLTTQKGDAITQDLQNQLIQKIIDEKRRNPSYQISASPQLLDAYLNAPTNLKNQLPLNPQERADLVTCAEKAVIYTTNNERQTAYQNFIVQNKPQSKRAYQVPVDKRSFKDFDGTLTGVEGRTLWLKEGKTDKKGNRFNIAESYKRGLYKNDTELKDALNQHFPNGEWRVSPEAIQNLRNEIDSGIDSVIVSRNYKEYIQKVLQLSGLEKEYIDKIKMIDRDHMPYGKGPAIAEYEKNNGGPAKQTTICDDSRDDFQDMMNHSGTPPQNKIGFNQGTSKFDWQSIGFLQQLPNANPAIINLFQYTQSISPARVDSGLFVMDPNIARNITDQPFVIRNSSLNDGRHITVDYQNVLGGWSSLSVDLTNPVQVGQFQQFIYDQQMKMQQTPLNRNEAVRLPGKAPRVAITSPLDQFKQTYYAMKKTNPSHEQFMQLNQIIRGLTTDQVKSAMLHVYPNDKPPNSGHSSRNLESITYGLLKNALNRTPQPKPTPVDNTPTPESKNHNRRRQ